MNNDLLRKRAALQFFMERSAATGPHKIVQLKWSVLRVESASHSQQRGYAYPLSKQQARMRACPQGRDCVAG